MAIFGQRPHKDNHLRAKQPHNRLPARESGIEYIHGFPCWIEIFTGLLLIISFVLCTSKCVENHTHGAQTWRIVIGSIVYPTYPPSATRLVPRICRRNQPRTQSPHTCTGIALHLTLSDIFTFLCIAPITLPSHRHLYIFKTLDQKQPSAQALSRK